MATSKRNTIGLIWILSLVGGAWAAEPNGTAKAPAPLSNTRYASCILNITADPELVPLSPEAFWNLVESSAVAAKAAREQLGIDEASMRQMFPAMIFQPLTDSSRRGGNPSGPGRRGPVSGSDRGFGVSDANQGFGPQGAARGRGGLETVTFRVGVTLPTDVKPAAEEFLAAVVENLRRSLMDAYRQRLNETRSSIEIVQGQRDKAQRELESAAGLTPDAAMSRKLDAIMDASTLVPETPFAEAIDRLRKSVAPALSITVLWRNLEEEDGITPDTPIQMDGVLSASVKTVLELLLKAVSPTSGSPLTYRWEGQVITIGTTELLGNPQLSGEQTAASYDALRSRRYDLDNQIQQVNMSLATAEAKRKAIEEQIAQLRVQADKKLAGDTVTQELQTILDGREKSLQTAQNMSLTGRISELDVAKARESLAQARIDLARRKEELAKAGGGSQLDSYSAQISEVAVQTAQDRAKLGILRQRLRETESQMAQASAVDARAQRASSIQQLIHTLDQRIKELQIQQASSQPPVVTVIGAN
jgi:hypothetical protein